MHVINAAVEFLGQLSAAARGGRADEQQVVGVGGGRRGVGDGDGELAVHIEGDRVLGIHGRRHVRPAAGLQADAGRVVVLDAVGGEAQVGSIGAEAPAVVALGPGRGDDALDS